MSSEIPEPHAHHAQHLVAGVALTAFALVLAFHYLLAVAPYGLSFALFFVLMVAGVHFVIALSGRSRNAWSYVFLVPAACAVAAEILHSSPTVRVLALPVTVLSVALFAYWRTAASTSFSEVPSLTPIGFFRDSFVPLRGLTDFAASYHLGKRWVRAFSGFLLAIPFLIVIGALFASADGLFREALSGLFDLRNLPELLGRFVRDWLVFFLFVAVGWTMLMRSFSGRRLEAKERVSSLDRSAAVAFLALLNLLFAVFIGFQAVYFFGGEAFLSAHGLSYAEYARSGFFQLLAVSGIVFAIVLWFYRYAGMRQSGVRWLNVSLVLMTGVVIASAVRRLLLYIDAFGLTVSRWWAMEAILLIAAVLLLFLVGAASRRAYSEISKLTLVGILILLSASFLVPVEATVAEANVDRFLSGKTGRLDAVYLVRLARTSSDAVPAVVALSGMEWSGAGKEVTGAYTPERVALALRDDGSATEVVADWRRSTVADYRAIAVLASLPPVSGTMTSGARQPVDILQAIRDAKQGTYKDIPESYEGDIELYGWNLRDLTGLLPAEVHGDLRLGQNGLVRTEGLPKTMDGSLDLSANDIVVLKGMPEAVSGNLNLSRNPLESLEGLPMAVGGTLYLYDVPARTMPEGVAIGDGINVHSWQVEFIRDARAKGYLVKVVEGQAM